jgi:hypothetical protein
MCHAQYVPLSISTVFGSEELRGLEESFATYAVAFAGVVEHSSGSADVHVERAGVRAKMSGYAR